MRPEGSAEELEKRRRRAVALLKEGYSQTKVAKMVGSSQGSVSRWHKLALEGDEALELKPHPGRERFLSEDQERTLEELLGKGAKAHGWQNDLWTCPRVKSLIEKKFGVDYHVDHVRKILVQRLGWTSQKPSRRQGSPRGPGHGPEPEHGRRDDGAPGRTPTKIGNHRRPSGLSPFG